MKKIITLIVLIICAGLGYFAYDYIKNKLDNDVRNLIIEYGTQITGTPVNLDSVKLDLKNGIGSLTQFTLKNPKGFSTDYALKFNKAELDLEVDTVLSDVIVIEKFSIDGASINYEDVNGQTNFDQIKANVDQYLKAKQAGEKTSAAGHSGKENRPEVKKEKRFIIKRFEILNTEAKASMKLLGKRTLEVKLANIYLNNLGQSEGGLTSEKLAESIVSAIQDKLIASINFKNLAKELDKNLKEIKKDLKDVEKNIKNIKKRSKKIKNLDDLENISKDAESLFENLENLF
jgi:hypothetical protein